MELGTTPEVTGGGFCRQGDKLSTKAFLQWMELEDGEAMRQYQSLSSGFGSSHGDGEEGRHLVNTRFAVINQVWGAMVLVSDFGGLV